ncbi:MAG: DUF2585 family protein [Chthoniobacterales bacterium]
MRIAKYWKWIFVAIGALMALAAGVEWGMGRSLFGPDGKFGFWVGDIWSNECSQRLLDPYAFTHIGHGILFFGFLWLVARRFPVHHRLLIAAFLETCWEILENSPLIINRYRDGTIALGYGGDSILNSMSDILMMCLGFLIAWRLPVWASILLLVIMEIGCALYLRDNLALNIIMLIHPIEAIKAWQMGVHSSL